MSIWQSCSAQSKKTDVVHVPPVARRGTEFAPAYLVGKKCAAIMQNGGFQQQQRYREHLVAVPTPLLLLIYYAGRCDRTFSTSGAMTEPVLRVGYRYYVMRPGKPRSDQARADFGRGFQAPVALLLTKEVLGRRAAGGGLEGGVMEYWVVTGPITPAKLKHETIYCLKLIAAEPRMRWS